MKLLVILAALCSVAYCRFSQRVVGGVDVNPVGRWPWQGSLQFRSSGSHTCGSSLISSTHAITAAHCVSNSATTYRVVFGLHDRTTRQQGRPENYNVASLRRHPQFALDGSRGFPNDVATLRLATNANLNNFFISTVPLAPNDGHMFVGDECYISGWGRLRGGGPLPNVLQEARIDVLSENECVGYWGSNRIQLQHVCIIQKNGNSRGACNGDSGGPLSCRRNGRWYVVGITSWVRTGCLTNFPSVYARVSFFNSWINANLP